MDKQDLEPLLNAQQSQVQISLSEGSAIENKALAVLAGDTAVLLFIAQANLALAGWQSVLLLAPFLVSVLMTALTFWPQKYKGPLIALEHHPEYLELTRADLILQLLADAQQATDHNLRLNTRRWHFCVTAIMGTAVGAVVLFAIL